MISQMLLQPSPAAIVHCFHLLKFVIFPLVGFKENLSLLDFSPRDLSK